MSADVDELELIVNLLGGPRRARAIAEALALPCEGPTPEPPSPPRPPGKKHPHWSDPTTPERDWFDTKGAYRVHLSRWRKHHGHEPPAKASRRVTSNAPVTSRALPATPGNVSAPSPVTPSLVTSNDPVTPVALLVTPLARASEGLSLCISEETKSFTAAAVSGVSDAGAHEPRYQQHPAVVTGPSSPSNVAASNALPVTPAPTPGGGGDGGKFVVLSPEAQRLVALLKREGAPAIKGTLVGKAARAFNELVEQLAGAYPDEVWRRFARAAKSGEAKAWWRKGFALPLLCNEENDQRSLCYGITRGLEGAQELLERGHAPQAPVALANRYAPGPQHVSGSLEHLRAAKEAAGLAPRLAAGGGT